MKTEVSIKKNVDKGKYVAEKQNNNYRHILIKLQKLYGSFSTPNALRVHHFPSIRQQNFTPYRFWNNKGWHVWYPIL